MAYTLMARDLTVRAGEVVSLSRRWAGKPRLRLAMMCVAISAPTRFGAKLLDTIESSAKVKEQGRREWMLLDETSVTFRSRFISTLIFCRGSYA